MPSDASPSPRHHRHRRTLPIALIGAALLGMMLAGCREENTTSVPLPSEREFSGDPRPFLLGFSDVPSELTEEAYASQFDFVAQYGEAILVQRPPSWSSFLGGADVSDALRDEVLAAREAARRRSLKLVVALDPFDPTNRGRLDGLPSTYEGRSLADPDLRDAFVAEAEFIARNMRPDYLALGSEINTTYERNPEGYFAFLEAYRDAYDAVKEASPQTQVFVTYQYEELLGIVPELPPHQPRWELLDDLAPQLDLLALTSYPSFVYPTARKVPPGYYQEVQEHTALPVAWVGVGFSSGATRGGVNASTEPEQRRFLQRLLTDAFEMQSPLVIWFAAHDLAFAEAPPYDLLSRIGLRTIDGLPKESWTVWEEASRRPIDPAAAAALLEAQGTATSTPESSPPDGAAATESPTAEATPTATPAN